MSRLMHGRVRQGVRSMVAPRVSAPQVCDSLRRRMQQLPGQRFLRNEANKSFVINRMFPTACFRSTFLAILVGDGAIRYLEGMV